MRRVTLAVALLVLGLASAAIAQPVTVFNTSPFPLTVNVNNGANFTIAASATSGAPAAATNALWALTPGPNAFGPGPNVVTIMRQGSMNDLREGVVRTIYG